MDDLELKNLIDAQFNNAKADAEIVKKLGEQIGYGHLMELASALWRKSLREQGYPESGAFITTVSVMLKDEFKEDTKKSNKIYDSIVKDI